MFEFKPDFEAVRDRYDAWWVCEIVDRPLVSMSFLKPLEEQVPWPASAHPTLRDRWMDTDHLIAATQARMANTAFYADALPITWPNLGPEVFSAFYGCPLVFGEDTSWSEPILEDWSSESVARLQLDEESIYFRKLIEMTDALLEVARGRFIIGYTDMHPGGDAIAAFRDPQQLCIDMVEHPAEIKALLDRITDDFLRIYDLFYQRLSAAGMPSTSWLPAICRGKYHIPSNDFSCMVSNRMFEEVFLPGIVRECRHMNRSIYHLDGPKALRFLDTLLAIPEIHAIQWVPGAGNDDWKHWIKVYQRIQAAHKAFILYPPARDLDLLFEVLRPEGAWLALSGVDSREHAEAALRKIARWGK